LLASVPLSGKPEVGRLTLAFPPKQKGNLSASPSTIRGTLAAAPLRPNHRCRDSIDLEALDDQVVAGDGLGCFG